MRGSSQTNKKLAEQLGTVPLFASCAVGDRRAVARHLEMIESAAGDVVVRQGDDSGGFFLVLQGELAVSRDGELVANLTSGDYFGELALLDPAPRSATVTATTDVRLGALNTRMFRVLLRDVPEIAFGLFESLARSLREARAASD